MPGHAERVWLSLLGLTLMGFFLAETGQASWGLSLAVAVLVGLKSRLLIAYYMEVGQNHWRLALPLYLFVGLIALAILFSHGWGDWLAGLTRLDG
ncbi:MAG: cytochrome C oxidase subunit IV family protein [Gammaproteobacteria bacterium SHHR-1]